MKTKKTQSRKLSPEALKDLLMPDLKIADDGSYGGEDILTVKKAEEAQRWLKLFKSDSAAKSSEKALGEWLSKQSKGQAERAKFRPQPYRLAAVHNSQTERRSVLLDVSPLFAEGGRALPFGMISATYQKIPATTATGKTPGTEEVQQIIITRTEPTKEELAKYEEKARAKAATKATKAQKKS
jgi:hypothetical protein